LVLVLMCGCGSAGAGGRKEEEEGRGRREEGGKEKENSHPRLPLRIAQGRTRPCRSPGWRCTMVRSSLACSVGSSRLEGLGGAGWKGREGGTYQNLTRSPKASKHTWWDGMVLIPEGCEEEQRRTHPRKPHVIFTYLLFVQPPSIPFM
jgi:hypothetical protein